MAEWQERLAATQAEERRQSRIDYTKTAYVIKPPYSNRIVAGPYRVKDAAGHRRLLDKARASGNYLWFGAVTDIDGRPHLTGILMIDWDSLPDRAGGVAATDVEPDQYPCPKCDKVCTSASGLTLHLKTCTGPSPSQAELSCPKCGRVCTSASGLTLHQKTCTGQAAAQITTGQGDLCCPVCQKVCTSPSGLTLHRQHAGH